MSKRIFLSHSSKDLGIIEDFLDLLELGMDIKRENVYCTSIKGNIATGTDFISNIRTNLLQTELVIFFITEAYLQSCFSLAEMGAAWIVNQNIYPIIVPPLDVSALEKTPLSKVQATVLDKPGIENMYDEFKFRNLAGEKGTALFNKRNTEFLTKLKPFSDKSISENKSDIVLKDKDKTIEKLKSDIDKLINGKKYYILSKGKTIQYKTNTLQWWKQDCNGYTDDLCKAGVFSEEEVRERIKAYSDTVKISKSVAVPIEIIKSFNQSIIPFNDKFLRLINENNQFTIGDLEWNLPESMF